MGKIMMMKIEMYYEVEKVCSVYYMSWNILEVFVSVFLKFVCKLMCFDFFFGLQFESQLIELIVEIDRILNEFIDCFVNLLKDSDGGFYDIYWQVRMFV